MAETGKQSQKETGFMTSTASHFLLADRLAGRPLENWVDLHLVPKLGVIVKEYKRVCPEFLVQ